MPIIGSLAGGSGYGYRTLGSSVLDGIFESIESFTVGSGGASEIVFGSGGTLPQTYKHLQMRHISKINGGTSPTNFEARFNGDTGSNYTDQYILGQGSTTSSGSGGGTDRLSLSLLPPNSQTPSLSFGIGIIDIMDYTSTNKYKTAQALTGMNGTVSGVRHRGGMWMNTAAVTSIRFFPSSNSFSEFSHFALYGVKA